MPRKPGTRQRRQSEILAAAARIFAERGYAHTRLEDVGAAVGISGPALYRYFRGKDELLAAILIDISIRLVDGAREVLAGAKKTSASESAEQAQRSVAQLDGMDMSVAQLRAKQALIQMVSRHIEFAVTEPDLIRIQDREIRNLSEQHREKVRSLQRTYLRMWVDTMREIYPQLSYEDARAQVQLCAGMINSSRHIMHWAGADRTRSVASQMALDSLQLS